MKTPHLFFILAISLIIFVEKGLALPVPMPAAPAPPFHQQSLHLAAIPKPEQRQPILQGTDFPTYYYHRDTSATEWGLRHPKQKNEQNQQNQPLYLDIVPEIRWPYPGADTPVPLVPREQ